MNTEYGNTGMQDGTARSVRHLLLATLLGLSACTSPQYETVNQEVLADIQTTIEAASSGSAANTSEQLPADVLQALVPGLTLDSAALQPVEERFDFAVQEPMDAREFFSLLTEGTDYSIAIHPGVTGTISTLDLKNVTIQEALDQVSSLYGYAISRTGNIFQVTPGGLQTRIFKVDYLNVNRNGNSNMSVVTSGLANSTGGGQNGLNNGINGGNLNGGNLLGGANAGNLGTGNTSGLGAGGQAGMASTNSGGASINTTSESDYWEDLEDIIRSIIGAGTEDSGSSGIGLLGSLTAGSAAPASSGAREVVVSPQTGMIIVRAYPAELDQVGEFLARSQDVLQRQVVLEAKILEVTLNDRFQAGIDLRLLDRVNSSNNVTGTTRFLEEVRDSNGEPVSAADGIAQALQLTYDASDFDAVIRLLETQGNVQVISSPRITTLNNQKAVFKVGDEEYFSTNPTSSTVTGGNATTSNQNANLQPFFSGIALDVTPQISAAGDIILHIHPLLNTVQEDIKTIGGDQVPLAKSDTRESDSIARARNGEVVIISGLMQTRARGTESGVPGARDVPVIGNAFEQTERTTEKTELVILLRAIVDEGSNMQNLIQEHTDGFRDLRQQIDPYYR